MDLTLQTDVAKPAVGQLFRVEAGASNPVDTVQVYLDFDPAILQLVEMDAGDTLEVGLESAFDNLTGRVDYAAGTMGDSASAPFTLVSLTFRAVNPTTTAGTQLLFAPLIAPRETKPIEAGANNLGTLNPLTLVIG